MFEPRHLTRKKLRGKDRKKKIGSQCCENFQHFDIILIFTAKDFTADQGPAISHNQM
jgi:hypothetical protein